MRFEGIDQAFSRTARLLQRVDTPGPAMTETGEYIRQSIDTNFEVSGRPTPWTPLAASTLRSRRRRGSGSKPLIDTGAMRAGIEVKVTTQTITAGSNAVQANRLHHGYPGGEGRGRARTPARPFVLFQPEDPDNIAVIFSRHYRS